HSRTLPVPGHTPPPPLPASPDMPTPPATRQISRGPSVGHAVRRPFSRAMPLRSGPRNCGQSLPADLLVLSSCPEATVQTRNSTRPTLNRWIGWHFLTMTMRDLPSGMEATREVYETGVQRRMEVNVQRPARLRQAKRAGGARLLQRGDNGARLAGAGTDAKSVGPQRSPGGSRDLSSSHARFRRCPNRDAHRGFPLVQPGP